MSLHKSLIVFPRVEKTIRLDRIWSLQRLSFDFYQLNPCVRIGVSVLPSDSNRFMSYYLYIKKFLDEV